MAGPVDVHVGRRLAYLRHLRGVSQTELAGRLGISYQQVQKYEAGTNRISASKMYDAAMVLGASIRDFFEGLGYQGDVSQQDVPVPTAEAVSLLRAYLRIQDKSKRAAVVALVTALADEAESVNPKDVDAINVVRLIPGKY